MHTSFQDLGPLASSDKLWISSSL